MEGLIEGFFHGGTENVLKEGFEKMDSPAPGYVPVAPVKGAIPGVPPGYVPAPGYVPVAPAEGSVPEGYPGYAGAPYGYVPAPGYVPVAPAEGAIPGVPPGYMPAPVAPAKVSVAGAAPAPILETQGDGEPAKHLAKKAKEEVIVDAPAPMLETQGDGKPAKHHTEKAKEEAIVEVRKKRSGCLTEKILDWISVIYEIKVIFD